MNDPMKSTMGALGAFAVAGGMLVGALAFTTPALAAEKPIEGTAACNQLVAANGTVQSAQDNVDAAEEELARRTNAGLPSADINAQRAVLTRAENRLAIVRANAVDLLCREAPVTPEPTTPPVTTQPQPEPTTPVTPPSGGQTTVIEPTRTVEVPAPTTSVDLAPRVNTNVEVQPTDDDDSVADVSGSQVSVVPEGSADTGGA